MANLRLMGASIVVLGAGLSQPYLCAHTATTHAKSAPAPNIRGYSTIQSTLPTQTKIPVRLPRFIPFSDKDDPIYVSVDSVSQSEYSIQLAWAKDCEGGNSCHLGEITGSASPERPEGRVSSVSLAPGTAAQFRESTCGAHCDDSVIYWTEGGYYYSIAIKAGKKAILLQMARSAITKSRVLHP